MNPAFLFEMTLERGSIGGFDTRGTYTPGTTTTVPFMASTQVASEKELRILPEGERNKTTRSFYSQQSFQMEVTENNIPADIITDHLGEDWKVVWAGNWSMHGYYHALAEALPVGSLNNPATLPDNLTPGITMDIDFAQDLTFKSDGQSVGDGDEAHSFVDATANRIGAVVDPDSINTPQWFNDPKITFPGDGWYTFGNLPNLHGVLGPFSAFFVIQPTTTDEQQIFCVGDPYDDEPGVSIKVGAAGVSIRRRDDLGTVHEVASGGIVTTATLNIVSVTVGPTALQAELLNVNQVIAASIPIPDLGEIECGNPYYLGSCGGVEPLDGDMLRTVYYSRELNTQEIAQCIGFLQNEFSI